METLAEVELSVKQKYNYSMSVSEKVQVHVIALNTLGYTFHIPV